MALREKAVKGIIWVATKNWGRQAVTFVFFIILSRLLGPEAFGLVALASVFTDFMGLFQDFGLGDAIIQRRDLGPEHLDTAFWTGMLIGGVMLIGGIAGSGKIAELFKEPKIAPIIVWLSLVFVISAFSSTQISILKRELAFKSLAIRSLVATILGGAIGVILAYMGLGVWSLVGQTLATGIIGAIVLWRVSDWRPKFRFYPQHFKELFTYGVNIIGISILDFFNKRTDDFLIGYFLGATMLGYYTVAYKLLLVMLQLLTGITTAVAFPSFARLQMNLERMRKAFYKATQYTSLIAFPAFMGIMALAPEFTRLFFGDKWLPSAPVMQILSLIGILQAVSLFNATIHKAAGKPSWWFGFMFLTATVNVIGFRLVVNLGIQAVAAAFVIVGYVFFPFTLLSVRRLIQIDLKIYLKQLIAPVLSSLFMAISVFGLKTLLGEGFNLYLKVGLCVLSGVVVYFLSIQLLARSVSKEILALVYSVFPKLKMGKA